MPIAGSCTRDDGTPDRVLAEVLRLRHMTELKRIEDEVRGRGGVNLCK
jgi:hypothetical protein